MSIPVNRKKVNKGDQENQFIDFKSSHPLEVGSKPIDKVRKEFVLYVASFANMPGWLFGLWC